MHSSFIGILKSSPQDLYTKKGEEGIPVRLVQPVPKTCRMGVGALSTQECVLWFIQNLWMRSALLTCSPTSRLSLACPQNSYVEQPS